MSRLSSFLDSGKMHVQDESFKDTVIDVINYMVLLAAYTEDKESKEYAQERNEEDEVNRQISKNWSEHAEAGLRCKDS